MALDHSLYRVKHTRLATTLDSSLLENLIKEYLTNCLIEDKTPGTISTYSQRLYDFASYIHSTDISVSDIRLLFQALIDRGLSPSTRHAYYRSIRTFFNWLINEGYIDKSPMNGIKPPRIPKKVVKPFSHEDIYKLLLLCDGNKFLQVRNRAMVLMFLDTGLRLAEMASIQLDDIDVIKGTIMVMGKGTKERTVRIGKTTRKALHKYLSFRDDNHPCLWVSEERQPMTRDGVKVTINHLCQRAGIPGGPHKLRHTAAINYLKAGMSSLSKQQDSRSCCAAFTLPA